MKRLSAAVFVFMAGGAPAVLADGPGWIASAKVTKIVVTAGGGINFRLSPELAGCTSQSGYGALYASVYPAHAGIDRIHATLLTAYVADKPIAVYLIDNTCKVGEVELGG